MVVALLGFTMLCTLLSQSYLGDKIALFFFFSFMDVCFSVFWGSMQMCVHTVGCICADMPLPTPAVPLLGTPIASMLMIRGFKGEGERD